MGFLMPKVRTFEPVAPTEPVGVDFRGQPPIRRSRVSVNLVEVFNRRAHVMRAVPLLFCTEIGHARNCGWGQFSSKNDD